MTPPLAPFWMVSDPMTLLMTRAVLGALVCVALVGASAPVSAQPPAAPTASPPTIEEDAGAQAIRGGLVPGLLSIAPGLLYHGVGTYWAGDRQAARNLIIAETVGIGGVVLGGVLIGPTGASRRTSTSGIGLIVGGLGLFMTSWMADVYGAFSGEGATGAPMARELPLTFTAGYQYVHTPHFQYRSFATLGAEGWLGAWRLGASGWLALDDDNQWPRASVAWRPLGMTGARMGRDSSWLEARGALGWQRYGTEGFQVLSPEVSVAGRYDLGRMGRSLRGAFVQGSFGYGFDFYGYDVPGLGLGTDTGEFLIADFGFGVYLGEGRGEARLYYDHRRDDITGGLGTTGLSGGIPGHFGVDGRWFFHERWGVGWLFEVGSAYVAGAHIIWSPAREVGR